jgi:spore coat protein JC
MFVYEKKLQYPINIKTPNAKSAKVIMTQLGGPDGELGASLRYLSQRYTAPYGQVKALLTDIGTEELGHVEMIGTLVYQLTRNLSVEQIKEQGFDDYFVDHTTVTTVTSFFIPDLSRYSDNKCRFVARGF